MNTSWKCKKCLWRSDRTANGLTQEQASKAHDVSNSVYGVRCKAIPAIEFTEALGSVKPCSPKARKYLPRAIKELESFSPNEKGKK